MVKTHISFEADGNRDAQSDPSIEQSGRSGEGVVLAGIGLLRPPAVGRLFRAVYRDRFPPPLHRRIDRHGSISRNDDGILGLPSRDDSVLHRSDAFRLLPVMTAASG
jgi:hypothetical protein